MSEHHLSSFSNHQYEKIQGKIKTPEQALAVIRSGNRVFVGTACATPTTLTKALENIGNELADVQLLHFLTTGAIQNKEGIPETRFKHKSFFVGTDTRDMMKKGGADYIPISIAQVPQMIETGRVAFDVALVQVSTPDEHGFVSLGVSVDITKSAVKNAKVVIAEINANMPRTFGDSFLHVDDFDSLVLVDEPVTTYSHKPADAVAEQIARYVARIIENGSTLQIGLGRIPNEMLRFLINRKDIGIHSDVITDPIADLVMQGVITGKKKTIHNGKIVASFCLGTRRLFDMIDRNPMFALHPIDYVCHPQIIAKNHQMVSVSQAFAIDLTGQICSDQFQGEFYSGVSTQPDFIRNVSKTPGGKPIICLQSTTDDGQTSRIRPLLMEGEGVTIPRSDVHYVVTEYGMVYLFGKSIKDRALAIIEIAHPKFRQWLLDEAKKLGYVREDQTLKSRIAYPVEEERHIALKNGQTVLLRPAKASDVGGLQDIFYHMSEKDIYTRFFTHLKSLSVDKAEHLCNVDYDNEMAFVATIGEQDNEQIVGSSCYFLNPTVNLAEVAYMIRPEWQGMGLGSFLQKRMAAYAQKKGIRGFVADVLAENVKMKRLAQRASNVNITSHGGTYEIVMLFDAHG